MQIKRIYGLNFRILFEKRISSLRKKCWGAQWGRLYIICLNLWKMFCDRKNVSCLNFKGGKKKSVWYVCWVFFYIVYANEINIFQYFLKNIRYKNTFERHILTYESWIRISQNQYPLCSDLYVGNAHCEFCRNWKNFFLKNELMKCVTYFFHIVYAHQINFLEFKCNV